MKDLVIRKESKRWPGLFVKKYSRRVFFDNLWHTDPTLLESRGHVENENGEVVVAPFTKIFNYGENNTTIDRDEKCVFVQKINGFMAAATWVSDVCDVVVSTTGSLDSDYVKLAEKYITTDVKAYIKAMHSYLGDTFIFEICDPSDPHIVPEASGAYLLGLRRGVDAPYTSSESHEGHLDRLAKGMGVKRPGWGVDTFANIVKRAQSCTHEGYVVYGTTSNTALKIKSPHYIALKAAARIKDISTLKKQRVDEEFYALVDHLKDVDGFNQMEEQERLNYMRKWINDNHNRMD